MKLLVAKELAPLLRVNEQTVRAWCREGRIPAAVREGRVLLFDEGMVLEALRRRAELARTVADGRNALAEVLESCAGRRRQESRGKNQEKRGGRK